MGANQKSRRGVNEFNRALALRIRAFRKARKLTQAELAHAIVCVTSRISQLESGSGIWSVYHLALLARHFGVPVTDFIPSLDEEQSDRSAA